MLGREPAKQQCMELPINRRSLDGVGPCRNNAGALSGGRCAWR